MAHTYYLNDRHKLPQSQPSSIMNLGIDVDKMANTIIGYMNKKHPDLALPSMSMEELKKWLSMNNDDVMLSKQLAKYIGFDLKSIYEFLMYIFKIHNVKKYVGFQWNYKPNFLSNNTTPILFIAPMELQNDIPCYGEYCENINAFIAISKGIDIGIAKENFISEGFPYLAKIYIAAKNANYIPETDYIEVAYFTGLDILYFYQTLLKFGDLKTMQTHINRYPFEDIDKLNSDCIGEYTPIWKS